MITKNKFISKILSIVLLSQISTLTFTYAQNNIGIGTINSDASSLLDLIATKNINETQQRIVESLQSEYKVSS